MKTCSKDEQSSFLIESKFYLRSFLKLFLTHDLLTQFVIASEWNSEVEGSDPTQANFL